MLNEFNSSLKDFITFTEVELEACLQYNNHFSSEIKRTKEAINKQKEVKINPQKNNKKDIVQAPKSEKEVITKMKLEEIKKEEEKQRIAMQNLSQGRDFFNQILESLLRQNPNQVPWVTLKSSIIMSDDQETVETILTLY